MNDGVEALAAWDTGNYAAVLADIHMPRMDGHEFTRQMRAAEAQRGSSRTPVVAVTANAMKGEDERCLAVGMDAYLAKPVNIEQLRLTLERWIPIHQEGAPAGAGAEEEIASGAFDRDVLAAWLGNDHAAINSLLVKFRDTAVEAERADLRCRAVRRSRQTRGRRAQAQGRRLDRGRDRHQQDRHQARAGRQGRRPRGLSPGAWPVGRGAAARDRGNRAAGRRSLSSYCLRVARTSRLKTRVLKRGSACNAGGAALLRSCGLQNSELR